MGGSGWSGRTARPINHKDELFMTKFGCHCEHNERETEPDACVIGTPDADTCCHAIELTVDGKGRESCEY